MSGGGTNTVSNQTVPSWLQPYLTGTLTQGQGLLDGGGPQYYQGNQVAPLTSLQNQGIADVQQTAAGPSASQSAADQNRQIESGAYLNPNSNPYLSGTLDTANQQVQNSVASQFGANGRNIVSSAPVQSSAMNQLANEIYGGAYQSGMDNMVKASAYAPMLDQGTYMPSQQLLQTGAGVQANNQNVINANMAKYNYQQQLPENMLSWYSGLLNQNSSPFHSSNSQSSGSNNGLMTDVGAGVTTAAAIYEMWPAIAAMFAA